MKLLIYIDGVSEKPIYVNPKQYERIMKRRAQRERLEKRYPGIYYFVCFENDFVFCFSSSLSTIKIYIIYIHVNISLTYIYMKLSSLDTLFFSSFSTFSFFIIIHRFKFKKKSIFT